MAQPDMSLGYEFEELDHQRMRQVGASLQCFEIEDCYCLRDIILTEEIEEERRDVICFARLNSLHIVGLPNLIFFNSGNHNIEFPLLKVLKIERCPKLIEFISQNSNQSGMHALFSEKVAVPSLEDMEINLSNVKMIFYNDLAPVEEIVSKGDGVEDCKCLRDIILTEEIEEERKDVICFPRLNSLQIVGLPNLIFFNSGNHNIEFPLLKEC
ncbi:hypothetical protein GOBAR_DD29617 [Gossypium barbadense]|nr:hypothetical protein GOBAR_DD29617 [Gossypium barbadense]